MLDNNRRRARQKLDMRLSGKPALAVIQQLHVPPRGYIRAIRDAIGMTAAQLGVWLNKSSQSILALEKSEQQGSISLRNLRLVAEAMDCDIVYGFIPKNGLENAVNKRAQTLARRALQQVGQYMLLEGQSPDSLNYDDKLRFDLEVAAYISEYIKDRELWSPEGSETRTHE